MLCTINVRRPTSFVSLCQKGGEICLENRNNVNKSFDFLNSKEIEHVVDEVQHKQACQERHKLHLEQGQNETTQRTIILENCILFRFVRNFSTSCKKYTAKIDHKKNYYQILGVTPKCSNARIKQAYYRLSKVYHPDVNKSDAAVVKFHEISEAYEILSDISLKHAYDSRRHGHGHAALHRGVRPHPVNFNASGPHQYRKTDSYNHDEWLKSHYTQIFKEKQKRKYEEDFVRDHMPDKHYKPGTPEYESQPNVRIYSTLLFLGVIPFLIWINNKSYSRHIKKK